MKERPILFSGPMVRAILEGRKTQTRRVVKCRGQWTCDNPDDPQWPYFQDDCGEWQKLECPHGTVGDRLWIRESFAIITLEITGVRVERLQEISDADCRAEGCCHRGWDRSDWKHPHNEYCWNIERANFASLWSSINGPESWSANPWVWVIEFRRVTHG